MKKITTLLFLFTFTLSFAQKPSLKIEKKETKITSISYEVDSSEELNTIDWKELKTFFSGNKQEENIKMTFGIDLKASKNKFKSSITVSGPTKNIDSLIVLAKKGVKSIIKISKNY